MKPKTAPKPSGLSRVALSTEGGPFPGLGAPTVKRRAERMLQALSLGRAELSIALVDDATIHALNRDYRKKNKPTDVLAFAMEEGAPMKGARNDARLLGDVIISVDTARRQATENGRALLAEVTMLLAHGILHLIGYDHQTDEEERVMTAKTRELEGAALGG